MICVAVLGCGGGRGNARNATSQATAPTATADAYSKLEGGFGIWLSASSARKHASDSAAANEFAERLSDFGVRLVMVESRTLNDEVIFPSFTHRTLAGDENLLTRLLDANRAHGIRTIAALPLFLGTPVEGEEPIELGRDPVSGELRLAPRRVTASDGALPYRSLFSAPARNRASVLLQELSRGVNGLDGICLSHAGYPAHNTDFSADARRTFEQFLGRRVEPWPAAVLELSAGGDASGILPGPLWPQWTRWRSGAVSTLLLQMTSMSRMESSAQSGESTDLALMANGYLDQRLRSGVNWVSIQTPNEPGIGEAFDILFLEAAVPIATRQDAVSRGLLETASLESVLTTASQSAPQSTEVWAVLSLVPYLNEAGQLSMENRRSLREALRLSRARQVPVLLMDYDLMMQCTAWEDVKAALTLP